MRERELLVAEKEETIQTKEKQMIGLERMLAEKEGELEGERAILTSLQQQKNDSLVNSLSLSRQQTLPQEPPPLPPRPSSLPPPRPSSLLPPPLPPQLINCIQSAQSVAGEVKKRISNPNLSGKGRLNVYQQCSCLNVCLHVCLLVCLLVCLSLHVQMNN